MYTEIIMLFLTVGTEGRNNDEDQTVKIFDLSQPATWKGLSEYYTSIERRWLGPLLFGKICFNCGIPALGTAMHLQFNGEKESMQPAVIPTEYLLTRLAIIDVTSMTNTQPHLSLSLETAQKWLVVQKDPLEPTLLLFKFGWMEQSLHYKVNQCVCQMPGLSYELAQWIAANLSHVVGVGTDAPSLETGETREHSSKTVVNVLGTSGIYMIENANLRRDIPESGCLAIVMPIKLLDASYVPARLAAFCPPRNNGERVVLSHQAFGARHTQRGRAPQSRSSDVGMDEILSR